MLVETRPIFTDDSDSLTHYGVKGMKWGVRNAETMRKYMGGHKDKIKAKAKTEYADYKKRRSVRKDRAKMVRNVTTMSDKDLKKFKERLKSEDTVRRLHAESSFTPGVVAEGKRITSKAAAKVIGGAATGAAVFAAGAVLKTAVDNGKIPSTLGDAMIKGVAKTVKK